MAYMDQTTKAKIAPTIKAICAKYGVKASLAVRNHSTLVLNIKSGSLDFIRNFNKVTESTRPDYVKPAVDHLDVNHYHMQRQFSGRNLQCLRELYLAMNAGNHDNSDVQTDYFDVGWYVDINVGKWNKPYQVVKGK